MKKYFLSLLFLSLFFVLISNPKKTSASICSAPTQPVCYTTVPYYSQSGLSNDGTFVLSPSGDVITPNGSIAKAPTKQVQVSCAGSQKQIDYDVLNLKYSICNSSNNNTPICIPPIVSGCTTQNDLGAVTVQQNLYGMGNSIVGLNAIQACKDQITQYQTQVSNYNACLSSSNSNSNLSGILSQSQINELNCLKADSFSHYDAATGNCVGDELSFQNSTCKSLIQGSIYSTKDNRCECPSGYALNYSIGTYGACIIVTTTVLPSQPSTNHVNTILDTPGTNILYDNTVYIITTDGKKRPYTSAGAFLSYGFNSWGNLDIIIDSNNPNAALPVGDFIPPRDGKIVCSNKGSDKGTCYLITDSKKAAFTSAAVFKGLGFSFDNSLSGDVSFLPSADNIKSAKQAHLAGTLINKNGTIYLISDNGLLGIPDMDTLNSWGYSLSDVVKANAADSVLSQAGIMASHTPGALSPLNN